MKRKTAVLYLIPVFLILLWPAAARATGLGFYVQAGSGAGDITYDYWDDDYDFDSSHRGFGLVLDTGVQKRKIFRYRLSIGYESFDYKPERNPDPALKPDAELDGLVIINDFGFRFAGDERFDFWAGPEVKIGFLGGDTDDGREIDLVTFGLGPVLGMDFNMTRVLTLGLKAGLLFSGFAGEEEDPYYFTEVSGFYTDAFVNASLIFNLSPGKRR